MHIRFSLLQFICRITLIWGWVFGQEEAAHLVVIEVAVVLLAGDPGSWGRYIWRQDLFCFFERFFILSLKIMKSTMLLKE